MTTNMQSSNFKTGFFVLLVALQLAGLTPTYGNEGELTYTSSATSVTITGYSGQSEVLTIPELIDGKPVTAIGNNAFLQNSRIRAVFLGANMKTIGENSFGRCTSLTDVYLNEGLLTLGFGAFSECSALRSISVPDSVTSVGNWQFFNCTSLTNAIIGNGLTRLGFRTFSDCPQLTRVEIGNSMARLDEYCFVDCLNLVGVYFRGNTPQLVGGGAFIGVEQATIYYKPGTTGWTSTFSGRPTAVWTLSYEEWSQENGLTEQFPNASGENDDADTDGFSNRSEMVAGTDPMNALSLLIFEQQPRSDDLSESDRSEIPATSFALYFQSVPGKAYRLYRGGTPAGPWSFFGGASATTTQKRVLLPRPVNTTFYHIQMVAP